MTPFEGHISVLLPDLAEAFESNSRIKERIFGVISRGSFQGVKLTSDRRRLVTPKCDLETKQILLDEGFLSYLWCLCCFIIGLVDMTNDKVLEHPNANIARLSDHEWYRLFDATLGWGRSLRDEYSPWPDYIPNPSQQDSELVRHTNTLWIFAVRSFMYHELGHLAMHSCSLQLILDYKDKPDIVSSADLRRLHNMEIQADDYALDSLLLSDVNEYERYLKYLGFVTAYIGTFYLLPNGDTRSADFHPDLDTRLQTLLKKVSGLNEYYSTLLKHTTNLGLQVFFAFGIGFTEGRRDSTYQDFGDLLNDLLSEVGHLKARYEEHDAIARAKRKPTVSWTSG